MTLTPTRAVVSVCLCVLACSGSSTPGPDGGTLSGSKSSQDQVLTYIGRDAGPFEVDQDAGTIVALLVVNGDLDIQNFYVVPDITLSPGASITPASGVVEDLYAGVKYTVTAEDGATHRDYHAQLLEIDLDAKDPTAKGGIPSGDTTPRPPGAVVVPTVGAALLGTWTFKHSATLEVRTVGADTVFTLLEQTPTTQTVTVKVNDTIDAPTEATGKYGYTSTFNLGNTYSGSDELGDTSTGTWKFTDLGAAAAPRYALDIDQTTIIQGGPSASGTVRWYITGLYPHALFLTRDPMVTSKATTTYDVTLVR